MGTVFATHIGLGTTVESTPDHAIPSATDATDLTTRAVRCVPRTPTKTTSVDASAMNPGQDLNADSSVGDVPRPAWAAVAPRRPNAITALNTPPGTGTGSVSVIRTGRVPSVVCTADTVIRSAMAAMDLQTAIVVNVLTTLPLTTLELVFVICFGVVQIVRIILATATGSAIDVMAQGRTTASTALTIRDGATQESANASQLGPGRTALCTAAYATQNASLMQAAKDQKPMTAISAEKTRPKISLAPASVSDPGQERNARYTPGNAIQSA
jgi:hypothetical protein